ncbi:MAG: LytTR family transcriptional regulator [Methylococcales bacterium]|nr:LytTR family transcriptional regulator [Methylococcales bacterium]
MDYLLKPIVQEQVREALGRFQNLSPDQAHLPDYQALQSLIHDLKDGKSYRKRFLVKIGDQYKYIPSEEICWMAADSGYISVRTKNGDRHLLDKSLEQIASELSPMDFFQISRGCLVAMTAIQRIHSYFNSRLRLELRQGEKGEFIVSRDRVKEFKAWLDR